MKLAEIRDLDHLVAILNASNSRLPTPNGGGDHPALQIGGGSDALLTLDPVNQILTLGDVASQAELDAHTAVAGAHHNPVTAGDGTSVIGQQIAVDGTVVRTSRQINTGAGLTGGGDLSADRALLIDLAATSGLTLTGDVLAIDDALAGDGLGISGKVISLTPATLAYDSANNATGATHTHAITASSNPGAASSLLKTAGDGSLDLESLAITSGLIVVGAVDIGQDLTVGSNVLFVDESQALVGINRVPDPQFALDVNGNIRGDFIVGKHAIQLSDATMICHFDGPQPYNTDFSGDPRGHMGQAPTITGPGVYRPGKFSKAVQAATATTNLVLNPIGANGITNWSNFGTGVDFTAENKSDAPYGSTVFRAVANSGVAGNHGPGYDVDANATVLASTTYTYSLLIRGSGKWELKTYDGSSYDVAPIDLSDGTTWQQFSMQRTTDGTAQLLIRVASSVNTVENDWIEFTAVQVEEGDFATPFCYGDLPGHSWASTAHASTSSRGSTSITYTESVPLSGTCLLWYKRPSEPAEQGQVVRGSAGDWFISVHSPYSSTLRCRVNDKAAYFGSGLTFSDDWHQIAMTWDNAAGTFLVYYDGVQVGSQDSFTPVAAFSSIQIHNNAHGWIDDLVFVDRVLSADEILAIYESDAPVFAESSTWSWTLPNSLAWADEEGLWMRDEDGNSAFGMIGVDGKSWGGLSLDKGDLLLGNAANDYIKWDADAGTLSIVGEGGGITNIDGGNIQTGTVTANEINVTTLSAISADLGTITAGTVTGALIRTAASGGRVEMDNATLDLIDERVARFIEGSAVVGEIGVTELSSVRWWVSDGLGGDLVTDPDLQTGTEWNDDGTYGVFTTKQVYQSQDCGSFYYSEGGSLEQAEFYTDWFAISGAGAVISFLHAGTMHDQATAKIDWNSGEDVTISLPTNQTEWRLHEWFVEKPAGATQCRVYIEISSGTPYEAHTFYIRQFSVRSYTSGFSAITLRESGMELQSDGNLTVDVSELQLGETSLIMARKTAGTGVGTSKLSPYLYYDGLGNYYYVIEFKDGTTTRYRYLQLNGTSATWTHATTLP